ncbi:uncharacterized protein [Patagioenas fasciata]|uniref:uncharacterized protein isoform X2 n=1 Tax=Patagioenas fasciata TaxID=372321 RepID=UPI003A999E53
MNLFCFSLEGSMDSLYEPVPEHQEPEDTTTIDSRASTPVSTHVNCGPPDRAMSLGYYSCHLLWSHGYSNLLKSGHKTTNILCCTLSSTASAVGKRKAGNEFPDFDNTVTKKRKSIQKSMSENEAFAVGANTKEKIQLTYQHIPLPAPFPAFHRCICR